MRRTLASLLALPLLFSMACTQENREDQQERERQEKARFIHGTGNVHFFKATQRARFFGENWDNTRMLCELSRNGSEHRISMYEPGDVYSRSYGAKEGAFLKIDADLLPSENKVVSNAKVRAEAVLQEYDSGHLFSPQGNGTCVVSLKKEDAKIKGTVFCQDLANSRSEALDLMTNFDCVLHNSSY